MSYTRGETLHADKLNASFSQRVNRNGDTMLGFLKLFGDPVDTTDAATKQYVDSIILLLGGYLPISGGTITGTITFGGSVSMTGLPESNSGLNPGDLWNNSGFLCIALPS